MRLSKNISIPLIVLSLCLAEARSANFSLDHYEKVVRLSEPRFSSDGSSVVLTLSRPNYQENRWEAGIYRIDLDTGRSTSLTPGRNTARSPRYSPSGENLAFLADVEEKTQVFVMPADGGEARQLTRSPTGVVAYEWKPDGTEIAYTAPDEGPEREVHDDSFYVAANDYLMKRTASPVHLWSTGIDDPEPRRLTSGTWSVNWLAPNIGWNNEGTAVAVTTQPTEGSRDAHLRAVRIARADASDSRTIEETDSEFCSFIGFSPGGSLLALTCPVDAQHRNQMEISIMDVAGGDIRPLTSMVDRSFRHATWNAEGTELTASAADAGGVGMWSFPVDAAPYRWTLGDVRISGDIDVAEDGRVAFIATTADRPAELYVSDAPDVAPRRVSDFNAEIAALTLGRTETIYWENDAFQFSGAVTYPPGFDEKTRYPVVLLIHGGPWAASHDGFTERSQLLAAQGWIVFQPNYRGSSNYGNDLYSAVYRDHGAGPGRDIMAGLSELKNRSYVDAGRIGVSGWSYGGYMTTWLIGHYTGWTAAMAGAAVIDLDDDYNLNDLSLHVRAYGETLSFSDDLALMKEQSPGSYVDAMETPLLMISTIGDARVPVTQSYKLFRALRERGREVELLIYPVSGHSPADPYRARDVDRKWVEWFLERL